MTHAEFIARVDDLQPLFDQLLGSKPLTNRAPLPRGVGQSAVYLFTDGPNHRYVGLTTRLRQRYACHLGGPAGNRSSFAMRLIAEEPSLTFEEAYRRIAVMQFRYVPIERRLDLHLLELYAACRLRVPFGRVASFTE